jgi:hypothetical protein
LSSKILFFKILNLAKGYSHELIFLPIPTKRVPIPIKSQELEPKPHGLTLQTKHLHNIWFEVAIKS